VPVIPSEREGSCPPSGNAPAVSLTFARDDRCQISRATLPVQAERVAIFST
jgi:hypothetical protein